METNKIKTEIMDEILKEVREEVREEVKEDIKTNLKSEIKEKLQGAKTDNIKEVSNEMTLYGVADIIKGGGNGTSEKDKETLVEIKKDVCSINERIQDLDIPFKILYVAIGCLYTMVGTLCLKYIWHVSNEVLIMCGTAFFCTLMLRFFLSEMVI